MTMYVTKKNYLMLHDALLKSFNAQSFIVINSWCAIGVIYASGYIGVMTTSRRYSDAFLSHKLQKAYFKTSDESVIKCPPHNDTLEEFSARCNVQLANIKKSLVKDVIRQMRRGELYIISGCISGINKMPSYEQFVVSFDLSFHRDV